MVILQSNNADCTKLQVSHICVELTILQWKMRILW